MKYELLNCSGYNKHEWIITKYICTELGGHYGILASFRFLQQTEFSIFNINVYIYVDAWQIVHKNNDSWSIFLLNIGIKFYSFHVSLSYKYIYHIVIFVNLYTALVRKNTPLHRFHNINSTITGYYYTAIITF